MHHLDFLHEQQEGLASMEQSAYDDWFDDLGIDDVLDYLGIDKDSLGYEVMELVVDDYFNKRDQPDDYRDSLTATIQAMWSDYKEQQ